MAYPRSKTVNLDVTEHYHVVSRCVRKSFLCGIDKETGESYEHRKSWIQNRLILLNEVFCIDICSYAVMSNHTHLVVRIDRDEAFRLSDIEVLNRWHSLYNGTILTKSYSESNKLPECEIKKNELLATVAKYRERLFDLSWFMKSINEFIAKKANKEDECTGHFWEGRYFSQAILDFGALISTMIYVDLNPLRAGLVKSPEKATFTSLYQRLKGLQLGRTPKFLVSFKNADNQDNQTNCIDITLADYRQLIDDTIMRNQHRTTTQYKTSATPAYKRLALNRDQLLDLSQNVEQYFPVAIGSLSCLETFKKFTGRSRLKGVSNAIRLYSSPPKEVH